MHSSSEYSRFDVKFARNIDLRRKYVLYRDTYIRSNIIIFPRPRIHAVIPRTFTVEHFLRLVTAGLSTRGGSLNR